MRGCWRLDGRSPAASRLEQEHLKVPGPERTSEGQPRRVAASPRARLDRDHAALRADVGRGRDAGGGEDRGPRMTSTAKWISAGSAACMLLLVVAWFYVYMQHVLPTLTRRGEPAVWPMRKGEMAAQLSAFRRISAEEGRGLGRYRFLTVGLRMMQLLAVVGIVALWWDWIWARR